MNKKVRWGQLFESCTFSESFQSYGKFIAKKGPMSLSYNPKGQYDITILSRRKVFDGVTFLNHVDLVSLFQC